MVPAGYKTDIHATIAPKPVPADVANRHAARNDTMINTFPVAPSLYAAQIIPPTRPDSRKIAANKPAKMKQANGMVAPLSPNPSSMLWQ